VPTIASLMTHFLAIETNQRYYAIPFQFVMMLASLVTWSPNIWSGSRWKIHLLFSLFKASMRKFEWLTAHSFSSCILLHGNEFFLLPLLGFLSTKSYSFILGPLLSYNGDLNPFSFLV
jgi:hypothetical protein